MRGKPHMGGRVPGWMLVSVLGVASGCAFAAPPAPGREVLTPPASAALVADVSTTRDARNDLLEGFTLSPHWGERTQEFTTPEGVRVHINAPSAADFDPRRPTCLALYALPNGNTIEWTIGRAKAEGLDWHYYIQHIGAQTRRLREVMTDRNLIVAYLETNLKSWPAWRSKHADNGKLILALVEEIRRRIGIADMGLALSCHSGGGSFIWGYLNAVERIPDEVERIIFLDANYSFSVEDGHDRKLLAWLGVDSTGGEAPATSTAPAPSPALSTRPNDHCLVVIAYDDREITFEGKKVVSPTGGTWRATHRMLDSFAGRLTLDETRDGDLIRRRGLNGRVDIILHTNPANKILHTVLVGDMSGFIHAMTTGGAYDNKAGTFGSAAAYEKWIQPD